MKLCTSDKTPPTIQSTNAGRPKGVTLIELLIVIAIVVILGLILITVFAKTYKLVQSWRGDAGQVRPVSIS